MDYLINRGQNEINDEMKRLCTLIPDIGSIEDLHELDRMFFSYFSRDPSTPKFSRSVIDMFNSRTFSGCSDIGMMMASILREKGIPTVYVETAGVDWLNKEINNLPGHDVMQGHIFLEIMLDDKWYLYDPTFHKVYDNYDPSNNNYPRGYYVFAKGENANSLGVHSISDERKLAVTKLHNYDANEYVDPDYPEIDLRTLESSKGLSY